MQTRGCSILLSVLVLETLGYVFHTPFAGNYDNSPIADRLPVHHLKLVQCLHQ